MQVGEVKQVTIGSFFEMAKNEGGTYEVMTPQGWKDIGELYLKKQKECFIISTEKAKELGCSFDHLVNTDKGWGETRNLEVGKSLVETKDGFEKLTRKNSVGKKDTYDWEVLSDEHAYFSNDIVSHNTGKTSIVKQMKNYPMEYNGKKFSGFDVVDIPLAQIEEMGDVLGCPDDFIKLEKAQGSEMEYKWVLAKDVVMQNYLDKGWQFSESGRVETKYAPPEWVPTEARPGIIIFDDGNRASVRILKGLMQLVQDYKTIGWTIPEGWSICFTGNPDMQNYLVTTQDDAMITRQRHITLRPDAKEWSVWAANAKVDGRGISFVLKYPEMMTGVRTNLRTLTEFFRCIERFDNIEKSKKDVLIEGKSLLDEETVEAFLVFVTRDMKMVIEPQMILDDAEKTFPMIDKLMKEREPRVDIVSVTCDRLFAHLVQDDFEIQKKVIENFQKFVVYDVIPEDMRHSLMRRIAEVKTKSNIQSLLLGNKAILKFVADSLRVTV